MNSFFKNIIILAMAVMLVFGGLFVLPNQAIGVHCGGIADHPEGETPECPETPEEKLNRENAAKDGSFVERNITDPLIESLALGAIRLSGTILWLGGAAFNGAVWLSIVNMSAMFENITAIEEVWTVIRDVANMLFIFILLYIAISTILGSGDKMKGLLKNVIIVALLLNFSLFFTKVVIDASNILALQFYKPFTASEEVIEEGNIELPGWDRGISNVFMNATRISTVFNPNGDAADSTTDLEKVMDDVDGSRMLVLAVGASIFLLILAFVFLSAALMFLVRFVLLMILMMLSPIAFLGMILPKLNSASQKWLKTLLDQAFFAPVFMILIYMVARVANSPGFQGLRNEGSVASLFIDGKVGDLQLAVNFIIVCGLAIAALVISKTFMGGAAKGAVDWSTKVAGRATFGTAGWAGRRTIGWAGQNLAKSGFVGDMTKSNSRIARTFGNTLQYTGEKAAKSSFDVRATKIGKSSASAGGLDVGKVQEGGYKKRFEDKVKAKEERFKGRSEKGDSETLEEQREAEIDVARAARDIDSLEAGEAREKHKKLIDAEKNWNDKQQELNDEIADIQHHIATIQADPSLSHQEKQVKIAPLNNDLRKATASLAKLDTAVTNATAEFGTLSADQQNYARAVKRLDDANKKIKTQKAAGVEFYSETLLGTPRTQTTIEAARKIRKGQTPQDKLVAAAQAVAAQQNPPAAGGGSTTT